MALGDDELSRFPRDLNKVTQFSANSIVDLTPLERWIRLCKPWVR